jgi:hypothetical protein
MFGGSLWWLEIVFEYVWMCILMGSSAVQVLCEHRGAASGTASAGEGALQETSNGEAANQFS